MHRDEARRSVVGVDSNKSAESFGHPNVLLTSTTRWALGARVAISLSRTGCEVSALCLSHDQPLLKTDAVHQVFPYSGIRPLESLSAAIQSSCPHLIVPCDDRAVQHLHELHKSRPNDAVAALIERSLGPPNSYAIVTDRYGLLKVARDQGLRVADTSIINTAEELSAWCDREPFPWVLKADNTFAGSGVRIASSLLQARHYFSELRQLFKARNALKRLIIDGDPFWLRPWWNRCQPTVVIQRFIQGTPANCAVVCWEGRILAGISVSVLLTDGPNKPATIVRVVKNREMMLAAERIAVRLHLSGFFGLDFIVDNLTGAPYLIEMNPRCAPPCHLALGHGHDLAEALSAQLSGEQIRVFPAVTTNDTIAYFPGAWQSESELFKSSFHDMPQGEPKLVEELLRASRQQSLFRRAERYLRCKTRLATRVPDSHLATAEVERTSSAIFAKHCDQP
jgi:predicted ATP-grasp superfamily ATP-dependent carboligase